jgi:hypothetical protein
MNPSASAFPAASPRDKRANEKTLLFLKDRRFSAVYCGELQLLFCLENVIINKRHILKLAYPRKEENGFCGFKAKKFMDKK